jgi:LPS export ABC transporter protein LptC
VRSIIVFVVVTLLALLLIQKFLHEFISRVSPEAPSQVAVDDEYVHTLKTVHLVESFKDNKEWELFAQSARNRASTASWQLIKVKVNFLDPQGQLTKVVGDEATFHSKERKLNIYGNVVVETPNGYVIKTKEIFYTSQDRQLFTLSEVEILRGEMGNLKKRPGSSIRGGFMRTSMQEQEILLGGEVKVFRDLNQGRKLTVESGQAKLSRNQGSAEFYEEVKINWASNQFSGEKAQFLYNEKLNQLKKVILTGNVKLQSDTRYASCDKAVLNIQSGISELVGNPRIVEADNQITGDIILLNHEEDTVQVKSVKASFQERK